MKVPGRAVQLSDLEQWKRFVVEMDEHLRKASITLGLMRNMIAWYNEHGIVIDDVCELTKESVHAL